MQKLSKTIKKENLKDVNFYSFDYNDHPLIAKYLKKIFYKWIKDKKISNPLEIPWMLSLLKGRLDYLEKSLRNIEDVLGEKNLFQLFDELEKDKSFKKINSIRGEIFAFDKIKKNFNFSRIEKVEKIGDWKCDDHLISVKTFLASDFNYQLIANNIVAQAFIEENIGLRLYNKIRIEKLESADDDFLNLVNDFLRTKLNIILLFFVLNGSDQENLSIGFEKDFYKKQGKRSILSVNIDSCDLTIFFEIKEDREGEKEEKKHTMDISFKKNDFNYITVDFDQNVYWMNDVLNDFFTDFLKRIISKELIKLDEFKNKDNFIGWINFIVHAREELVIANNERKIYTILQEEINKRTYKVFVYFIPEYGFDMKKGFLMKFN